MSRRITLVKHARPHKDDRVDAHRWSLSPQGQADAEALARRLLERGQPYHGLFSSTEPKAAETAAILGQILSLTPQLHPGLEEHDRSNVPLMKTAEFVSAIELFFRRPHQLVLGRETGRQALRRFEAAVDALLDLAPGGNLIIVSHGTVIALWIAQYCQLDGYGVWRQMGLPSYVTLDWPSCDLVERVDQLSTA